ncbi:sensor histidine kinase [Lichenibacterium dinghuense]|uniref:sensor histidine kinase n=1 Tax=Lichenibacterium dinghuense TaxID=2895977 RepID=UPI001F39652D|nr:HAMP domain-containing sensor histidine kinase [Lichenibacterium sp. 6Y81]
MTPPHLRTRRPRSLRARLALGAVLLVVGAVVATGLVDALTLRRFMEGQIDSRLDTQINTVTAALGVAPDGRLALRHDVEGPPFDRPGSGWSWEVLSGTEVVARSGSLRPADRLPPPPDGAPPPAPDRPRPPRPGTGFGPDGEMLRLRSSEARVGPLLATVLAAAPLAALTDPLRDVLVNLTFTLALLGAALVGAALVQVRVGLEPLRRLQRDLAAVRAGRIERIPRPQPAEVAPLVAEVNALLDENAENLARARRHVANLAHGLKTPLATLAVKLDASAGDPDGQLGHLVSLMDRRIRHHLGRARAAALGGTSRVRTDLAPRVDDLAAALPKIYADRGIACQVSVPSDLALACDAQDLDEMLGNLMDNAFKWARSGVRVTARAEDRAAVVAVEDDGPGLPDGAVQEAMRPGRRLDEASPGHGFGLPIARELAELSGGGLRLGRSGMGGLGAELTLPLAES